MLAAVGIGNRAEPDRGPARLPRRIQEIALDFELHDEDAAIVLLGKFAGQGLVVGRVGYHLRLRLEREPFDVGVEVQVEPVAGHVLDEQELARLAWQHRQELARKDAAVLVGNVMGRPEFHAEQHHYPEQQQPGRGPPPLARGQPLAQQQGQRRKQGQHVQRQSRSRQAEDEKGHGEPQPEEAQIDWHVAPRALADPDQRHYQPWDRPGHQCRQIDQQRPVPFRESLQLVRCDSRVNLVAKEIIEQAGMALDDHQVPGESDHGEQQ